MFQKILITMLCCAISHGANATETVFVAGATGRTGWAIVQQLCAEKYAVIALYRDPSTIKDQKNCARWVQGNVRDIDSLRRGMTGANAVISAVGATTGTGPNAPEFIDFAGTRNLVDVAKEVHARQFVLIASGRSGPQEDHSGRAFMGYGRYFKTKGELYLKTSGVPFTVLGAAGLAQTPAGILGIRLFSRAEYSATTKSTDESAVISINDLAAVAVQSLSDTNALNKAFAVMNDPARKPGTWRAEFSTTDSKWP